LRRREVLRWLFLLEASDLLLDVLLGFLALYLVDRAHLSAAEGALGVTVWLVAGLLGTLLLIPTVERIDGLRYVRLSAAFSLLLFPAFLLVPYPALKLILLAALGLAGSGWYPVLQARLYTAMPDRSGTVMALTAVTAPITAAFPFALGLAAQGFGLDQALWLLLAGPLALVIWIPRSRPH
jgi:FSR family fosmidomycin resistance protein-like MFS transporter